MFIDASALCAMIALEDDAKSLLTRMQAASERVTSPLAIWETVVNLPRLVGVEHEVAEKVVASFLLAMRISVRPVPAETTKIALSASRLYGRGRHKAALNFGDCFAYACAKHYKMSLLYKGDDFVHTDIEAA